MSTPPELRSLGNELNVWIRFVESGGAELNITLLVSGTVVTGWLTPDVRYRNWAREVLKRTQIGGGKVKLPTGRMPPIGPKEVEQARAAWDGLTKGVKDPDVLFPTPCLRNAEFRTGLPAEHPMHSYVLVATTAVDAFTLGAPVEPREEPPTL